MGQKTRVTLKEYFESGKIPTEGNFIDLIDSLLNMTDDEVYVRVMGGGNPKKYIGIGTSTPDEQLEIAGKVKAAEFIGELNWKHITNIPNIIPRGTITMWSGDMEGFDRDGKGTGALMNWALCNGKNGTPDLQGRFVVGWGKSSDGTTRYAINDTGGKETHVLTKDEMPSHNHSGKVDTGGKHRHHIFEKNSHGGNPMTHHNDRAPAMTGKIGANRQYVIADSGKSNANTGVTSESRSHSHTIKADGGSDPHENRPPYYTLAYIMKL